MMISTTRSTSRKRLKGGGPEWFRSGAAASTKECCAMTRNDVLPTTHQRNLAKLPPALAPLIERPQWCVWRWTQKPDGKWQKPPFQAKQPKRLASTNDPNTRTDYLTALAAV